MKYICSNCGNLQDEIGERSGCAHTFWGLCITVTLLISLFYWVGFLVLALEIILSILTQPKSNCCHVCKAKDCVIPVNTPRGEKIFNEYYEKQEEEEEELETGPTLTEQVIIPEKNSHTSTKYEIAKSKNWKKFLKTTIINLSVILFILWLIALIMLPMVVSNDKTTNVPQSSISKIEQNQTGKVNKQVEPKSKPETLENSPRLQALYKAEIEKTINIETAKAKKEIDKTYQEADELYNHILATESYTEENCDKLESYSSGIDSPVFWLYVKLIDITKKYINIGETPVTDFTPMLSEFIEPTLKKYNISNLNKLIELSTYASQKQKEIETRTKGLWTCVYNGN